MITISKEETNQILTEMKGQTIRIEISSPSVFAFFNGDKETCESNLYSMVDWSIKQNETVLIKKGNVDEETINSVEEKVNGKNITDISTTEESLRIEIEGNILIVIDKANKPRAWEIRLKKKELFLAPSTDGKFTKADYIKSVIK